MHHSYMTGKELRAKREALGLSQAKLAELSGISQHLLSAFERGKTDLSQVVLNEFEKIITNDKQIVAITNRKKRYQKHTYITCKPNIDRASLARQTDGNAGYRNELSLLWNKHFCEEKPFRAISLFSGCGGLSLGFSAAGFSIIGHVELEQKLRTIYSLNFPAAASLGADITSVSGTALRSFAATLGSIDAIIGGPPCQGFSLAGKRNINDPRNQLFKYYLRFLDSFRPKIALMENVRLLTSMKNQAGHLILDDILASFSGYGYDVQAFEINAKDYGVPQHRERIVFIAVRRDLNQKPSIPPATHGESGSLVDEVKKYRTFADACSDLPFIESGQTYEADKLHEAVAHPDHVIKWLWDVKQGASAHDNKDPDNRPPSGYNTTYKRQIWDEPASTVQTTFGMISGCRNVHPIATRSLTIREAARIQSFPDEFSFSGTRGDIRKGLGNAVPPLLAYVLAAHLRKIL